MIRPIDLVYNNVFIYVLLVDYAMTTTWIMLLQSHARP